LSKLSPQAIAEHLGWGRFLTLQKIEVLVKDFIPAPEKSPYIPLFQRGISRDEFLSPL